MLKNLLFQEFEIVNWQKPQDLLILKKIVKLVKKFVKIKRCVSIRDRAK
ncbi:hypothetical protein NUACC26_028430 [Scytonema sp. NUACC26]